MTTLLKLYKLPIDLTGYVCSAHFLLNKINILEFTKTDSFTSYTALVTGIWLTSKAINGVKDIFKKDKRND